MNMIRKDTIVLMVGVSWVAGAALAQDGRPSPQPPTQAAQPPEAVDAIDVEPRPTQRTADGRRHS